VGASTVACTAEDAAGNVASGSFTVTVTPPPPPPPTPPAECPRDTGPFLPTLGPWETQPDLALPGYRLVDTGPLNEVGHGGWLAVDACFRLPGST
jgi:hypothetical protein